MDNFQFSTFNSHEAKVHIPLRMAMDLKRVSVKIC